MRLILLLLASAGAFAETQAEFDTRQYQAQHLELLRRQVRAAEERPIEQLYYSRGQAVGDTLHELARKLDERRAPRPSCVVQYSRVYCEGN
jgi:Flp pilus assembly protein TadB